MKSVKLITKKGVVLDTRVKKIKNSFVRRNIDLKHSSKFVLFGDLNGTALYKEETYNKKRGK